MLAAPDFRESMEQAMAVAALTPDPGERVSLLRGIELALQNAAPTDWGAALSARAATELAVELRIEKAYNVLSVATLAAANTRAANGDLRGVQALVEGVLQADDRLGRKRPQNTSALLGALEWRLAEAARVREARDAWALRLTAFRVYRHAIDRSLQELRDARKQLMQIRERSGPSKLLLPRLEQHLIMGAQMLAVIRRRRSSTRRTGSFARPSRWRRAPRRTAGTRYHRPTRSSRGMPRRPQPVRSCCSIAPPKSSIDCRPRLQDIDHPTHHPLAAGAGSAGDARRDRRAPPALRRVRSRRGRAPCSCRAAVQPKRCGARSRTCCCRMRHRPRRSRTSSHDPNSTRRCIGRRTGSREGCPISSAK